MSRIERRRVKYSSGFAGEQIAQHLGLLCLLRNRSLINPQANISEHRLMQPKSLLSCVVLFLSLWERFPALAPARMRACRLTAEGWREAYLVHHMALDQSSS